MTFLKLDTLQKSFGPVIALDHVSLDIASGSRVVVVGPSGCGKTTLLRLIAGFEAPDAGRIVLDGQTLADGPAAVPAYRRNIGIVAQDGCLFPHLTVASNIAFGMKGDDAERKASAAELMELVGLERSMLARRPDELSGGQQQRVALARALARKPRLMLLDEPFSALDTGLRAATRKAVGDVLRAAGIATLLVTHDQGEALAFADQVAVMRAGKLVQVGPPRELYARPADPQTAVFLGEAVLLPATIGAGEVHTALGRLAAETADRGPAEGMVMLRPEQISVGPAGEGTSAGRVTEVGFRGGSCALRIVLNNAEQVALRLEVPSVRHFEVGQEVGLQVTGSAHVFGGGTREHG